MLWSNAVSSVRLCMSDNEMIQMLVDLLERNSLHRSHMALRQLDYASL